MAKTVKDICELCNVKQMTAITWIQKGYLKAHKEGNCPTSRYIIEDDDFDTFLKSDYYYGHPEDIKDGRAFLRNPCMEDCYPANLILKLKEYNSNLNYNIWDVDFRSVWNYIHNLSDRDQRVIELRYQFGLTLDEIAKIYNLTKERVRQIQIRIERKLLAYILKGKFYIVDRDEFDALNKKYKNLLLDYEDLQKQINQDQEDKSVDISENVDLFIEEIDLSVRSYNCLKRAGINTISDIIKYDKNQNQQTSDGKYLHTWFNIRNLGRKSLLEIAKRTYECSHYRIQYFDTTNGCYAGAFPVLKDENLQVGTHIMFAYDLAGDN